MELPVLEDGCHAFRLLGVHRRVGFPALAWYRNREMCEMFARAGRRRSSARLVGYDVETGSGQRRRRSAAVLLIDATAVLVNGGARGHAASGPDVTPRDAVCLDGGR
jgi:hypothetical protein